MPDRARSLVEAYVYLDLMTMDDDPAQPVVTEEGDAWRVRRGAVEVLVPFTAENEVRQEDLTFGSGRSELIDAGQWVLIASTYGDRALEGALMFAADSSDEELFDSVTTDWRFAADATAEALKFLPTDPTDPTASPGGPSSDGGFPGDTSSGGSPEGAFEAGGSMEGASSADELPAEAFWTGMGRTAYEEDPAHFTRAALEDDLVYYRQSLIDFHRLHTS
jgi:hypothetical protein